MSTSEEIETLIVKDLEVSENVVIPLREMLARPALPVANHGIPPKKMLNDGHI